MTSPAPQSFRAADISKLKAYLLNLIARELESDQRLGQDRVTVVKELLNQAITNLKVTLPQPLREQISREVFDDLLGFGPLQPLK
jgi:hypothetical protein